MPFFRLLHIVGSSTIPCCSFFLNGQLNHALRSQSDTARHFQEGHTIHTMKITSDPKRSGQDLRYSGFPFNASALAYSASSRDETPAWARAQGMNLSGPIVKPDMILTKVVGQCNPEFLRNCCRAEKTCVAARKPLTVLGPAPTGDPFPQHWPSEDLTNHDTPDLRRVQRI